MYQKDFFKLQLDFVDLIHKKMNHRYEEALFLYTSFYVRLLGYMDDHPPEITDVEWQKIIQELPQDKSKYLDYFYDKYLAYEHNQTHKTNQKRFGCFSYSYHKEINQYELHFGAHDPDGNLGKDRIPYRIADLQAMFTDIKRKDCKGSTLMVTTWLLNIEAFFRLYPPKFRSSAKLWNIGTAQTLTFWGQFVDRFGKLQNGISKQLLVNAKNHTYSDVNEYFPYPALKSELPIDVFLNFYKV